MAKILVIDDEGGAFEIYSTRCSVGRAMTWYSLRVVRRAWRCFAENAPMSWCLI